MSSNSKTSVVIVTHEKYLPYLKNAVDHLKTNKNHELIVVCNGCSADISADLVIAIPSTTLAKAANIGITKASGEYVMRLDADDFVDSSLIETEEAYLDAHPFVDCVWCDYVEARIHSENEAGITLHVEHSPQESLEHACGALLRKQVFLDLGGYDEELPYQEAYDFWQRFYQAGYRAKRIEQPLYLYRRGHESMSTNPERDEVRKRLKVKYGAIDPE